MNFLDEIPTGAESRPNKKRRIANDHQRAISVYDEEEVQETEPTDLISRPVSRRSAGSGSLSLTVPQGDRSEFERAAAIANPRRKKARTSNSNAVPGSVNGYAQSSAIAVDDDDIPKHDPNPRQLQFEKFEQGAGATRDRLGPRQASDTTSKHFTPKMNHSTLPSGLSTKTAKPKSSNLRDVFTPGPLRGSSLRGTKPNLKTWPLRCARAHNYEESEEGLFLRSRVPGNYCITSSDPNDIRYEFTFKQIVKAFSDQSSRIRLQGSMNAASNVQFKVDLQFAAELDSFETQVVNSVTKRSLIVKTE